MGRNRHKSFKNLPPADEEEEVFNTKELKVFIIGHSAWEQRMFRDRGYQIEMDVDKADIVVWLGGADIDPALYGEESTTYVRSTSPQRDAEEVRYWRMADGKFKAGICRGGQLLNVLNGGKLWQHVTNHAGKGSHDMLDIVTGKMIQTSSVHHQAFRPTSEAEIVAVAKIADKKWAEKVFWERKIGEPDDEDSIDYEVVFYPESRSLCFQGHPEYTQPAGCTEYFFDLIERYYNFKPEAEKVA